MPATRKRTAAQADGNKKQKTKTGARQTQPEVSVDEGFDEDGTYDFRQAELYILTRLKPKFMSMLIKTAPFGMRRSI